MDEITEKISELTKEEIKKMLIVAVKYDSYSAKCFAFLLLKYKKIALQEQKSKILEEFIELLSVGKREQAIELINEKY